ncbi:MAG: GNAT family N-acetyltransferase [Lachnospiraceae bacterium]|nr:GNAT family N-acetyltransferase [Lachnospiraceae bacterium]
MEKFCNEDILKIAAVQSAEDMNCREEDFFRDENVIVPFSLGKNAKRYYKEPITCNFISYGNNIVSSVTDEVRELVTEYLGKFEFYHCFETPNMHWLNDRLMQMGHKICFMAEYYLPDVKRLRPTKCDYELRVLEAKTDSTGRSVSDFSGLYLPEWSNALCEDRKELDVLGMGAYYANRLIGLAGCSADAEMMWQIGVDVLPEYRRQGIATALTSGLAVEIMKRGKVPFYCSAWSNIRSVRNAIKSGFVPAWVEMTAKPERIVDEMNL